MEPTNVEGQDALPPTTDLSGEAPTVAINTGLLPTMAQHCTRCGAHLAADQRYCVQCGERRGDPRLPFMDGRTPTPQTPVVTETYAAAAPPPPPSQSRWGSGATLIAGVGTLLLALGVGVLIGNAGKDDNSSAAAATPQVITVQGGGSVAASNAADTTAKTETTASKDSKDSKDANDKAADKSDEQKQEDAKAVVAAPSGSEIPQAEAPVVKKGQSGSGPGYKDGKFTGDFFGQ